MGRPYVKAYDGPMPDNAPAGSFEFYTSVPKKTYDIPGEANWYPSQEGVRTFEMGGTDWAAIPVQITRIAGEL